MSTSVMGGKTGRYVLGGFAALVLAAGCGDKGDNPVKPGEGDDKLDQRLVLDEGYGWVATIEEVDRAYIFKADGHFTTGMKYMGLWEIEEVEENNIWYNTGNKLYVVISHNVLVFDGEDFVIVGKARPDTTEFTYSVSNNKLTLNSEEGSVVFTKMELKNDEPGGGEDEPDQRLILEDGYGWVGEQWSMTFAYIFKDDGRFVSGMKMMGKWSLGGGGEEYPDAARWHTNGNKLYIVTGTSFDCELKNDEMSCVYTDFDTTVYTYSVSGNKLTLSGGDLMMPLALTKMELIDDDIEKGEMDSALVNTDWINEETGDLWSFDYDEEDGGGAFFESGDGDFNIYACRTSDGKLYLTPFFGEEVIYTYSISGDELTLNGVIYLKTDESYDYLNKKLSKKGAKVKLQKRFGLLK